MNIDELREKYKKLNYTKSELNKTISLLTKMYHDGNKECAIVISELYKNKRSEKYSLYKSAAWLVAAKLDFKTTDDGIMDFYKTLDNACDLNLKDALASLYVGVSFCQSNGIKSPFTISELLKRIDICLGYSDDRLKDINRIIPVLRKCKINIEAKAALKKYYFQKASLLIDNAKTLDELNKARDIIAKIENKEMEKEITDELNLKYVLAFTKGEFESDIDFNKAAQHLHLIKSLQSDIYFRGLDSFKSSVSNLLNNDKYELALNGLENLPYKNNIEEKMLAKLKEQKSIKEFEEMFIKAKEGNDPEPIFNAARFYFDVFFSKERKDKAIEAFKYLVERFNYELAYNRLIQYYEKNGDLDNLFVYLESAARHNKTGFNFKEKYKRYCIPYFDADDFSFNKVDMKNPLVNINENNVNYFIDYYKKKTIDDDTLSVGIHNIAKSHYNLIMNVKYMHYNVGIDNPVFYFKKAIEDFLSNFHYWYIVTVPSSNQIGIDYNPMTKLLEHFRIGNDLLDGKGLIIKTKMTTPKHYSNENRSWKKDLDSLGLNKSFDYKDKAFIIFDDVTTTGASLLACKKLLMDAGAKYALCIALARTKED